MFITIRVVNMFLNKDFILASKSKSRYRILKNVGLKFSTTTPVCNEDYIKKKLIKKNNLTNIPKALAKEKAISISKKNPNKLVVGSDTVIIFKSKLINKARNFKEAEQKLKKLSGKKHKIISAVSVCVGNKQIWCSQQQSTVKIKKINEEQIKKYLEITGSDILSSVGCYQAERAGPRIIESIKGDFFNVLGFPLFPFLSFLSRVKK